MSVNVSAYPAGSLVHARGRDWVVLPSPDSSVLLLRPLTGGDEDVAGLFLPLEGDGIRPASFAPPDPMRAGDVTGALLLQDAARLSLRAGTTPFRSLGRIAVIPRPYQFVPLIMALRLDPVRLLLADDVGVGKTIEAAMIARELLDRGIARRLAVICASHLCDQWHEELREKFGIGAVVVQPSTVARLERNLPRQDLSIYQHYPHLVISVDYVKSDRNRGRFLQNAPDLIIVDEAHTMARPRGDADRSQHQRYRLIRELADDSDRHLLLVTATPHSGIEESFRSLLGLLDDSFDVDPSVEIDRARLLPCVVQRRRSDLVTWLGSETPFPERQSEERTYQLSPEYQALFDDVLDYCRETVETGHGLRAHQQRVRHWAAIALLRCLLSSPAAAVAVLSGRARRHGGSDEGSAVDEGGVSLQDLDSLYRPQVLDPLDDDAVGDYLPTAPIEDADRSLSDAERRRLSGFVRRAEWLQGSHADAKLGIVADVIHRLLRDGFRPIVFCRFIATARYLEEHLPGLLSSLTSLADGESGSEAVPRVVAVTGEIGEEERRARIEDLAREPGRVLIATDCLSEGINLQQHFDAVVHYDLPWNPNRLEQREGRVDRFGQTRSVVRTTLIYGANNPVDLVVLDVLIRKARTIRQSLGISVPVPGESEQVVQAVIDSVLLRGRQRGVQLQLSLFDEQVSQLHLAWDEATERERRQRAYFAQRSIEPDEVARELDACDPVLGDSAAVQRFLANALQRLGGELRPTNQPGVFDLHPGELRHALETRGYQVSPIRVAFDALVGQAHPTRTGAHLHLDKNGGGAGARPVVLGRTHPIVAACCEAVLGAALAPDGDDRFARSGAVFTPNVTRRTGVALLRLRYLLHERVDEFAEEVVLVAFQRQGDGIAWLEPFESAARELLAGVQPVGNMAPAERAEHVAWALNRLAADTGWYAPILRWRVGQLQSSHDRLRRLVRSARLTVEPREPPDILGCYVLVPAGGG